MRERRELIAIDRNGNVSKFDSLAQFARIMGTSSENVKLAVERGGMCMGLSVYDTPDVISKNIEELKKRLEYVKNILHKLEV